MAPSMRYLVVRALLFLVPFTVLMIAAVPWWLSLLVSLAFAFAASIVFFGKLREEAAADLQRIREGRKQEGAGPDDFPEVPLRRAHLAPLYRQRGASEVAEGSGPHVTKTREWNGERRHLHGRRNHRADPICGAGSRQE